MCQEICISPSDILLYKLLGCCSKFPQTRWLKTVEIYSLIVLRIRCLKSWYQQGHAPSEDARGESSLESSRFRGLLEPPAWQQTPASASIFPVCLRVSFLLSLGRHSLWVQGTPSPVWSHLNPSLITSAKIPFPNKVIFLTCRWTWIFCGTLFNPQRLRYVTYSSQLFYWN